MNSTYLVVIIDMMRDIVHSSHCDQRSAEQYAYWLRKRAPGKRVVVRVVPPKSKMEYH